MGFFNKRKSITIWIGVNKNGKISMHTVEPTRNEDLGVWVSNSPFVNSVLYENLSKTIEKTSMNWESSCEVFQIQL
jgi:hypothetical protein